MKPLAEELGLEYKVFSMTDKQDKINEAVAGQQLVMHCAGPFVLTCEPMIEACIVNKAHYLDITGEHNVLSTAYARHEEAVAAGIALIPAVGFDVVPSDMLIAKLAEAIEDPTHISVMLEGGAGQSASKGTTKSIGHIINEGGKVREGGKLITENFQARKITMTTATGKVRKGTSFPLADVVSGYKSTGVPNITMYVGVQGNAAYYASWLFLIPGTTWFSKKLVDWFKGDPPTMPEGARGAWFHGKATNAKGDFVYGSVNTIPGYDFTFHSAVAAIEAIANGAVADKPGAHSPASAFGSSFADDLVETIFVMLPVNQEPEIVKKDEPKAKM